MIVTTVLLVLLAGAAAFAGLRVLRVLRADLHSLQANAAQQLADRNAEVDRRLEAMTATMDRRLETATKTTSAIHQQLGQLGQANAEILARANDLKKLEQALRPPKARGGFGELLLGNLLRDRLPPDAYELQYGFKTGERVDAVIRVERLVPVDAKFPLDNFERLADAETDGDRTSLREGVRTRSQAPRRRDRLEVHPARRRDLRLRAHVPAVRGRTTSSCAARQGRCSSTRTRSGSSLCRRRPSRRSCR